MLTTMRASKPRFRRLKFLLAAVPCVLISNTSFAQSSRGEDDYNRATIFARAMQVENATALSDGAMQIDEMQTRHGLTLEALRRSELMSLALDYELTDARFDKETQADESYWEGESEIGLGNATTVYELEAYHSSRRILNTPGASPLLLSNSQDRVIYGISPLLKLRVGDANSFAISYDYSEVSFDESDSNDSARQGFDVSYTRFISSVRELTLRIGEREIDYDTSDVADYDTETVSLEMLAEHRAYAYQISLGVSRVTPFLTPDAAENEFIGDFSLQSFLAGNVFSFFANRSVSDSSQGSANDSFFSTDITYDAAIAERDQIIRTSAGLGWEYRLLCQRCTLGLNVGVENSEYLRRTINDARQDFIDVNIGYDFSSQLSGRAGIRSARTKLSDPLAMLPDTDSLVFQLQAVYQFNRIFSMSLQHERDERTLGEDDEFVVSTTGLTATLTFE